MLSLRNSLASTLLQPRTALVENLWTFSSELDNASWSKVRATVTPNVEATADALIEDTTATNTHLVSRANAGVDNSPFTFSGEFKPAGRDRVAIFFFDADAASNFVQVDVNLTTQTTAQVLGGSGSISLRTASLLGDSYVRVVISGLPNPAGTGGLINWQARMLNASGAQSYTGDGTSGILFRNLSLAVGNTPAL